MHLIYASEQDLGLTQLHMCTLHNYVAHTEQVL